MGIITSVVTLKDKQGGDNIVNVASLMFLVRYTQIFRVGHYNGLPGKTKEWCYKCPRVYDMLLEFNRVWGSVKEKSSNLRMKQFVPTACDTGNCHDASHGW